MEKSPYVKVNILMKSLDGFVEYIKLIIERPNLNEFIRILGNDPLVDSFECSPCVNGIESSVLKFMNYVVTNDRLLALDKLPELQMEDLEHNPDKIAAETYFEPKMMDKDTILPNVEFETIGDKYVKLPCSNGYVDQDIMPHSTH